MNQEHTPKLLMLTDESGEDTASTADTDSSSGGELSVVDIELALMDQASELINEAAASPGKPPSDWDPRHQRPQPRSVACESVNNPLFSVSLCVHCQTNGQRVQSVAYVHMS